MASIGSLSSSTSSLVSGGGGLHGYGGLASGLDRDTLIESMTYATRAKIAKQQQKKQTFQWKQDAYRSVTDKLVALSTKYMDFTNPSTNLTNSSLFSRTNIIANGKNSSKVSVTSNGTNAADSLTILGVKQLAKNTSSTNSSAVSDGVLRTGTVGGTLINNFYDENLKIEYGGKTYTVRFGEVGSTIDQTTVDQLNAALKDVKIDGNKTLDSVAEFQLNGSEITLKAKEDFSVTGGSEVTLKALLGLKKDDKLDEHLKENPDSLEVKAGNSLGHITADEDSLYRNEDFIDRIAGKTLNFNYNGQDISIKMPSKEELEALSSQEDVMKRVEETLQKGFDKAIGEGRVAVEFKADALDPTKGSFDLKTTLPGQAKAADKTSVLTLTGGSAGMIGGNGAFNALSGENNKLNLDAKITDSGLQGAGSVSDYPKDLTINGKTIQIKADDTINSIMDQINHLNAGVKISYLQNSDKFTISATVDGASGNINISGAGASLFGDLMSNVQQGQDAIVTVQYAGSSEQINLVRGSNTFTQDGLNITVKGTFGKYKEQAANPADDEIDTDANIGEEITFESKANVDNLLTTIKDMVTAYNEVVDLVNSLVSTKPDRDYAPLTDDQKEDMSEEQIEKWEKKAKEGILFGDDLLRNLSSDLRFVAGGSLMNQLEAIGISEVSGYSSNGKLTIDETKLKNALESDPDKVAKLFTDSKTGLMTNMKKITDSYAKTWGTKGSLIQRAGSESSAISLTDNEMYKSMKDIDDIIKQLQTRLKSEQDRYISQFTRLETVIAQMNSQSSYLSSMSGGY